MRSKNELNNCGCCGQETTKPSLYNRPGLDTLDYRIAVYGSFFERMISRLSCEEIPDGEYKGKRPLRDLTTRSSDDFTISLIDSWAMVGDVLTFYQERIANEGFLRTATERRSILELARAIGYELKPGVAADTYLAFTVDESDTTPDEIEIQAGTQVQSLPQKQDELPQTFETGKAFTARPAWNLFVPRQTLPQLLSPTTTRIVFKGINTNLRIGDHLLIVGSEKKADHNSDAWDVRRVISVNSDPALNQTTVIVTAGTQTSFPAAPRVYAFREQASIFGHNAVDWPPLSEQIKMDYLGFTDPTSLTDEYKKQWPRFSIFAPSSILMPKDILKIMANPTVRMLMDATVKTAMPITNPPETKRAFFKQLPDTVDLDNRYSKIVPVSWVYLATASDQELYFVEQVIETSRSEYMISTKVTRLQLDGPNLSDFDDAVRELTVYAAPEELSLAEIPITDDVTGTSIVVNSVLPAMSTGHPLIVSGIPIGEDAPVAETVVVKNFLQTGGRSEITLENGLTKSYPPNSVEIFGNVVAASHGETMTGEVLGHGNGAAPHQTFSLNKTPLTYTSANTVNGSQSTLTIRVDNVAWESADSLYQQSATAKVYTVRIDDDGNATVHFGDAQMGARLPTGVENIEATYRSGIGQEGEVDASTLTLLKTKPYGVKSVTNPVAAEGAEDPEKFKNARDNAPVTVRTLDRIVSRWDYEDFAASFSGIGKAQAVPIWDGTREVMHITVADPTGNQVSSEKISLLISAMEKVRDPLREVIVENFISKTFSFSAWIKYDDVYEWHAVKNAFEAILKETFSFSGRQFGQTVSAAEILAVMHNVDGVIAVDLDELYINNVGQKHTLNSILGAGIATYNKDSTAAALADRIKPAGLLTINPDGIDLKEKSL